MNDQTMQYSQPRPAGGPRAASNRRGTKDNRKTIAKAGMTVSLGALVATSMMSTERSAKIHLLSGVALVGFSLWHYSLYQPSSRK